MGRNIVELRQELRPMLELAVPVALAELGWMAMGVVDTIMVGRLGAESLGAVGLGRAAFLWIVILGVGVLLGLDTLVSNAFGAGRLDDCRAWLVQGIYLAVFMAVPMTVLVRASGGLLESWGVDPAVLPLALPYLRALSWSTLPLLLATAFRRYLQALNLVRPVMIALVSANIVNAVCNWILIFGRLGAPALGAEGAGWATGFSNLYMALFLLGAVVLREHGSGRRVREIPRAVDLRRLWRLLRLGLPAGAHLLVEVGVFALVTALAAKLDALSLAAHQIAITLASVTFMVPLGISSAAAVRVGQALGRRDRAGAARAGWTAVLLGAAFMSLAALVFFSVPRVIIRIFTDDVRVVTAGVGLLFVAAAFQLFDGVQVVATGALRGAAETRVPLYANLCGYWVLGLPVGYSLCFSLGYGALGLWIGLCIGLILVAVVLLITWRRRVRGWASGTAPSPG